MTRPRPPTPFPQAQRSWRHLPGRLRRWPTAWGLLGTALGLGGVALLDPAPWQGLLLAVPLTTAASGLGWVAGAALVPIGLALVALATGLAGAPASWSELLALVPAAALGVAAGGSVYELWRATEGSSRRSARSARLLSDAALELQRLDDAAALYEALPRLLGEVLDFTHASVVVPEGSALRLVASNPWTLPEGFTVGAASVAGRAWRQAMPQYVPDTREDPQFVQVPGTPETRTELALPLLVEREVVAVLNVEHVGVDAFREEDRRALQAFAMIAEASLKRIRTVAQLEARAEEEAFFARLHRRLLTADSATQVASAMLQEVRETLDLDGGAVLHIREGHFVSLAASGRIPPEAAAVLEEGLPWGRGRIHLAWQKASPLFLEDYLASEDGDARYAGLGIRAIGLLPILDARNEVKALLSIGSFERTRAWDERDRRLLGVAADALGVALERAFLSEQFRDMLEVVRQLAQAGDPASLYRSAVEAAVRLVPGSDAASLLVREAGKDEFRFAATVGYDHALMELPSLPLVNQLAWYGEGEERFRRGEPRLIRGDRVPSQSLEKGLSEEARERFGSVARLAEIRANICVPIANRGEVIGILNVDSRYREDAFGRGALQLAEAFAQQVAVTIRQAQYRRALEGSVVTDALTGLGNREGFNRQLKLELDRARRYDHPVNLAMFDLNGFKRINDTFGHQEGDRALLEVADAMRGQLRSGDTLFRWGGDEFALILPQVSRADALRVAERYAEAVGRVHVGRLPLSLSIGLASYPMDANDAEALLRKADDLMYRHKHG